MPSSVETKSPPEHPEGLLGAPRGGVGEEVEHRGVRPSDEVGPLQRADPCRSPSSAAYDAEPRLGQDVAHAVEFDDRVVDVGADGEREVRRQRPRCGRPRQDPLAGLEFEPDRERRVLTIVVHVVHPGLGVAERRLAAPAVGEHAEALVDEALVPQRLERPHDALHVGEVEGLVVVVEVDPARLAGHVVAPLVGVLQHARPAGIVELVDPELGDRGMAGDAEFLFGLDLGRQAVAVPAEAALDPPPAHRLVARDGVLDEAGQQVAVVRQPVGERRAVVEDELVVAGGPAHAVRPSARTSTPSPKWPGSSSSRAGSSASGRRLGTARLDATEQSRPPMEVRVSGSAVSVVEREAEVAVGRRRGPTGRRRTNPAPTGVASPSSARSSISRDDHRSLVSGRRSRSRHRPIGPVGVVAGVEAGSWSPPLRSSHRPSADDAIVGGSVVGRRQQRAAHVAEAGGNAVGDLDQFGRRVADTSALGDEELLEVVDVGLEEITAGLERVDLAGPASRSVSPTDVLPRGPPRASRRPSRGSSRGRCRLVVRRRHQLGRLGARLGDQRVGGPLGQHQRAADRVGLVGRHVRSRRARPWAARVGASAACPSDMSCRRRPRPAPAPPSPSTGSGHARVRRRRRSGNGAPRRDLHPCAPS